jgi:hypothetical protein
VTGPERAGDEAVQLPELPAARAIRQSAQRAESVTPAPGISPAAGLAAVSVITDSDQSAGLQRAAERAQAAFTAITAGSSLLHAQAPSLAQSRERHQAAAAHHNGWALRAARSAYGHAHLLVKALLHVLDWVLESPARLVVAVAVVLILIFWL